MASQAAFSIAISVLAIACHGDADSPHKAPSGPRLQLVYDIDLDRVVDDVDAEVRRDLVATLGDSAKSITISAAGVLQVTPSDQVNTTKITNAIEQAHRGQFSFRDCDADPRAVCFGMLNAVIKTAKQAALAQAVKTVQERLVATKQGDATAIARGQQIVVELPPIEGDDLEAVRSVIARKGRVELKVVDDGSEYMKRLFAHVAGPALDSTSADPTAKAAGIHTEVDAWSSDSGSHHYDFYLIGSDKRALVRYVADLAAADPAFKVPDDRELAFERIEPDKPGDRVKWRSYYLERAASLTGSAIADAHADIDRTINRPIVNVELTRKGARDFEELTTRIVGKKLATIVDGRVTSVPVIMDPIRGGRLWITMGGSDPAHKQQDANELALVLKTGALPAPLVLASIQRVP